MKEAIGSVNKIKSLLTSLRKRLKPPAPPEGLEPLEVLTLSILRRNATLAEALDALRRLHEEFVDFNEMRVAPPKDIVDLLAKNLPDARTKAEQLTQTLNRVYDHGNALDLEHMAEMGKRELREHLRGALLLDEYAEAYMMSHLFDSPVLPVDERLVGKLKGEGYLCEGATVAQARDLLEQAVGARGRLEACELLSQFAAEPVKASATGKAPRRKAAPARAPKAARAAKAKPVKKAGKRERR